jgi:hypothetical protein
MALLIGLALLTGSAGFIWINRPRDGVESSLFKVPIIGPSMPLVLTISVAFGVALIVKGLIG